MTLDVHVRGRPGFALDRALFSVALQEYGPLTLHLPKPVAARAAPVLSLRHCEERSDAAIQGHQHGARRYLAILTERGVIAPDGYVALIAALGRSEAAIAVGAVALKTETGRTPVTLERRVTTEPHLHAAVFDRERIAAADLADIGGDLLGRLRARYPLTTIPDVVADLYVRRYIPAWVTNLVTR